MRTRTDGTKFKVRWGPGRQVLIEPKEVVVKEKLALRNWLDEMNIENPRRYNAIMKFHPEYLSVFDCDNSAEASAASNA